MIRHGVAPFLECSSRGDRRFSAFGARVSSLGGRTIEEVYQGAKVFSDGRVGLSWREAKGRRAANQAQVAELYGALWDVYIRENAELMHVLKAAPGLSDIFGKEGHACQATELWRIRGTDLHNLRTVSDVMRLASR